MRLALIAFTSVVGITAPALAGDRLDVGQLAARSVAAVLADVELEKGKRPARVRVVEVLWGRSDVAPTGAWANACAGSAADYRRYLHQNGKWPENKYWRSALRQRRYQAVLFIAPHPTTKELQPSCEVERMLMEHTSLHPGFEAYLRKARRAAGTTDPVLPAVLARLCSDGDCQGRGHTGLITVLRDKEKNVALLVYTAMGCSHPRITYHDRYGKFLVAQQSGPREPDEWNSPSDRKISELRQGLSETEHHGCSPPRD